MVCMDCFGILMSAAIIDEFGAYLNESAREQHRTSHLKPLTNTNIWNNSSAGI